MAHWNLFNNIILQETLFNSKILILNIHLTKKSSYFFQPKTFFNNRLIEQYILDIFFFRKFEKLYLKEKKKIHWFRILKITTSQWKRNYFNFRIKKLFINIEQKKIRIVSWVYKKQKKFLTCFRNEKYTYSCFSEKFQGRPLRERERNFSRVDKSSYDTHVTSLGKIRASRYNNKNVSGKSIVTVICCTLLMWITGQFVYITVSDNIDFPRNETNETLQPIANNFSNQQKKCVSNCV